MNGFEQTNSMEASSLDRSTVAEIEFAKADRTASRGRASSGRRASKRPDADVRISGSVAAFLVLLAAVFARTAVIEGTPLFHPLATLAFIGACTVLIGGRIRALSALEESYIDAGFDEPEARSKAKETLDRMSDRGIDRPGS